LPDSTAIHEFLTNAENLVNDVNESRFTIELSNEPRLAVNWVVFFSHMPNQARVVKQFGIFFEFEKRVSPPRFLFDF